jgi:glycosyltransferase involved in cell wall biosynthesis
MKVAFLVGSVSRRGAGVSESVRGLAQALVKTPGGIDVVVLAARDPDTERDLPLWGRVPVFAGAVAGPRSFGYVPGLRRRLAAENPDLVHVEGLWMYPSVACSGWARAAGRPYVVTPSGMLDAWALRNSAWKKRAAGWLFERRNLKGAACLHALCEAEVRAIRGYGLSNPVCVVPNGVDLPSDPATQDPPWASSLPEGSRVLLFLGRLHPKKGLRPLLRAWAATRASGSDGWRLVIAGWDQGGHEAELRQLAEALGLTGQVHFVGPQFGWAKAATLARADAFVLPSLSEGVPVSALEAWAYRLPVLMSAHCNLPEGFAAGAALPVEPTDRSIAAALAELFRMSDSTRRAMGERGRRLVEARFSWPRVALAIRHVYEWVLGGGSVPDCVRTD